MQYKVPQKIDLEDKIIGPLTLKQFLYLLGGGMIDYLIFSSAPSSYITYIVIFIVSVLALAFAFIKIQDQEFSYIVISVFTYLFSPKKRIWSKGIDIKKNVEIKNISEEKKAKPIEIKDPDLVKSRLQSLSEVVDTHGWGKQQYREETLENVKEGDFESRVKSATEAIKNINLRAKVKKKKEISKAPEDAKGASPIPQGKSR